MLIEPTVRPGGGNPVITVPSTPGPRPNAVVTLVLTNGPDVVTVSTTVERLVNVAVPSESSTQTPSPAKPKPKPKPNEPEKPSSVEAGRSRGAPSAWS